MDGVHPNREVLFVDNSIPIPFQEDIHNPSCSYHLGFSLSKAIRKKLDEFEASIVHITVPDCVCLHLIQYARDKEIPLMGTYHSNIPDYMDHYPGLGWLKPMLGTFFLHQYGFLQALFCPTPFIHKHLSREYKMDKATSLQIWGRGIDLERFSPDHSSLKFRRSLGIRDDEVVIVWVGRLVPEKRTDIFASVIKKLHARNISVHTLIVGQGWDEETIKSLPNSTFCGWLDGDQLSTAYASSDIFLFPSAVETFGNVTLEAAASGLPLVVEAGCSGHLVQDGVNGFACTNEDDFFQATLNLVLDHGLRERCAKASRDKSLEFEKHKVVKQMLDNYSHVTDEFYCEYGGHHENRDAAYLARQDTFYIGTHPRPMALRLAEHLIVLLLRIMTWLWLGFVHVMARTTVGTRTPQAVRRNPPVNKKKQVPRMEETLTLLEEGRGAEDATIATASLSEVSLASSESSEVSRCVAIGDGPFCLAVAWGFINLIAFMCRMESAIRNCVKSSVSKGIRKRKDSSLSPTQVHRFTCDDGPQELKRRLRRSPLPDVSLLDSP
jgi:glycosyltransferase involved in cell wall biosynthesis